MFDIKRVLASKIIQRTTVLCRTARVGTIQCSRFFPALCTDFFFGKHCVALRTICRHMKNFLLACAHFSEHLYDIGDDVSSFLQNNRITDTHVEPTDLINIVQCCTRDCRSIHKNGTKVCHGSNRPRASDLYDNVFDNRRHLFCREFECNNEPRCLPRVSKSLLHSPIIYFEHDSIKEIILFFFFCFPFTPVLDDIIDIFCEMIFFVYPKSERSQKLQFIFLR